MDDQETPEPQAKWTYHLDHPSTRTDADRLEHYRAWLARSGDPYVQAVLAAGAVPWFSSEDERRERFYRRYQRPAAPAGLAIPTLKARTARITPIPNTRKPRGTPSAYLPARWRSVVRATGTALTETTTRHGARCATPAPRSAKGLMARPRMVGFGPASQARVTALCGLGNTTTPGAPQIAVHRAYSPRGVGLSTLLVPASVARYGPGHLSYQPGRHSLMYSAAEILRRAIAGLKDEPKPELEWYEKWIELNRRHEEFERQRAARDQAEREAAAAPQTTVGIVGAAIAGSSAPLPLNGAAVLRAAVAGLGADATINGHSE